MDWINLILIPAIKSVVLVVVLLTGFAYLTWFERKVIGRFQQRIGPNRAWKFGLGHPIADALKMIFKEEIVPSYTDKVPLRARPGAGDRARAADLCGRAGGADDRPLRQGDPAGGRRREHRHPVGAGRGRSGHLRHRPGRLSQHNVCPCGALRSQRGR